MRELNAECYNMRELNAECYNMREVYAECYNVAGSVSSVNADLGYAGMLCITHTLQLR